MSRANSLIASSKMVPTVRPPLLGTRKTRICLASVGSVKSLGRFRARIVTKRVPSGVRRGTFKGSHCGKIPCVEPSILSPQHLGRTRPRAIRRRRSNDGALVDAHRMLRHARHESDTLNASHRAGCCTWTVTADFLTDAESSLGTLQRIKPRWTWGNQRGFGGGTAASLRQLLGD